MDEVAPPANPSKEDLTQIDQEESTKSPSSGDEKEPGPLEEDDQLIKVAKAQVGEAREENKRLKQLLAEIITDYHSLQSHYSKIIQKEDGDGQVLNQVVSNHQIKKEEADLISLSLGRNNSGELTMEEAKKPAKSSNDLKRSGSLSLALDCKLDAGPLVAVKSPSSQNSLEESKEDEQGQTWSPTKMLKNVRTSDDDVLLQQAQTKKARVSVRARCDTPTMHDGCQWRKYGQKIAKGNPCPRAYYRCTISTNCPVRKQVQRCVEDMSILITTYEGTHNHPLPLSATAMASTTSAAVSMLSSRSSTSQQLGSFGTSISAPIAVSGLPSGLQFSLPQATIRPHHFPFQTTSISTFNSHPTITLDLTAPNETTPSFFNNRVSSSSAPQFFQPLPNFSPATQDLQAASPWNVNFSTYGTMMPKQPSNQELLLQQNQLMTGSQSVDPAQQSLSAEEAITTATKILIASNPTLRNALAAAITSLTGNGNSGARDVTPNPGTIDNHPGLNVKLGQSVGYHHSLPMAASSNPNATAACGSSFLTKQPQSLGNQQASMSLLPLLPHSSSRSTAAGSPSDSRDHIK